VGGELFETGQGGHTGALKKVGQARNCQGGWVAQCFDFLVT